MIKLYQKQKDGLIGIDIGSTSIKLLEVSKHGDVCRIERFAVVPLDEGLVFDKNIEKPGEVGSVLKRVLDSVKPKSNNVAFSVPLSSASLHKAKFDVAKSDTQIGEEILSSLSKYTQLPLNEIRVDYLIHAAHDGKKEVDILSVKNESIDSRGDILKNLNLVPLVATIESSAIENALQYLVAENSPKSIALFDIGHSSTTMYILNRGKITSSRELPVGGGALTTSIQNFYGISSADAENYKFNGHNEENFKSVLIDPFYESIGDTFSSALNLHENNNDDEIKCVVIAGGTANLNGLIPYLNEVLERPVEVIDPFRGVQISPSVDTASLRAHTASLLVVFGLALSEVGNVLNALPWREDIRKAKDIRYIKGAIVSGLIGALISLAGYSYYKHVEAQELGANQLINEAISKYQLKANELADVSKQRAVMIERMKLIQGLQTQRPVLVNVLNATVSALPNDMFLTAVSREGNSFTFQGKARDATVVADFLRSLKATGWYSFTFMNSFVAYTPTGLEDEKAKASKETFYGTFTVTADVPAEISHEAADKAKKAAEASRLVNVAPNADGAALTVPAAGQPQNITVPGSVPPQSGTPSLPANAPNPQNNGPTGNAVQSVQTAPAVNGVAPQVAPNALPMSNGNVSDSNQPMIYSGGSNGI